MLPRRFWILIGTMTVGGGSMIGSLAWGLYLHSPWYRLRLVRELSQFFDLPVRVGRVVPASPTARRLFDVAVSLPDGETAVFRCREALWQPVPHGQEPGFELVLRDGFLRIDPGRWRRDDYARVLRSGLEHDFAALGLRRVRVEGMDVRWSAPDLSLTVGEAEGMILFLGPEEGRASLVAHRLNGHGVRGPIHVYARFRPLPVVRIEEITLDTPEIPVAALGLRAALGVAAASGTFGGRVVYRREDDTPVVLVGGAVRDLDVGELAQRVWGVRGVGGRLSVTLEEARIRNGRLERLAFRGQAEEVRIGPLAALVGLPLSGGVAHLRLHDAEITEGRLRFLAASGRIDHLDLGWIGEWLGGAVVGQGEAVLHHLTVREGRLDRADVTVEVRPPAGRAGTISRDALLAAVRRFGGLDLGMIEEYLPAEVEYVQFGVRLVLEGGRVRVLGTHGADGGTILTASIGGRAVPLLRAPARMWDIRPLLAALRRHWEGVTLPPSRIRWWSSQTEQTAEASAAGAGVTGSGTSP